MISVLNVAYPFAPVSQDAVGGAEQVLRMIDHALIEGGHRSFVIAQAGSRIDGTLLSLPAHAGIIDEAARSRMHDDCRRRIQYAINHYTIDVMHFHGVDCAHYLPKDGRVPQLVTLHLPPDWYEPELFERAPAVSFSFVSHAQARQGHASLHAATVIENGVEVKRLDAAVPRADYAFAMGRICPEKGLHHALDAAIRSNSELLIAARVFPYQAHQRYFAEQIIPRLDQKRRLIGPLSWERKRLVLSSARCVLIPSLAQETSSLVAMEAMACGTPVIAFRVGALPDIVEHGVTGFIVDGVAQMAEAIGKAGSISSKACRQRARERFSARRMTGEYIRLYHRLAARPRTVPKATEEHC